MTPLRRLIPSSPLACLVLAFVTALPLAARADPVAPLLTLLEGDAFLLRASDRFALSEGVALQRDDILEVPAASRLARLEFADGTTLALGPDSRALLAPRLAGERAGALVYLLSGWAKLAAPAAVKAALLAPALDVATTGGTLVMAVQPAATLLFAESGGAEVRPNGVGAQSLKSGELMTLPANGSAGPDVASRPTAEFIATLPRAFMDPLPARAARFRDHPAAPRKIGSLAYADARPWLNAEPGLRRAYLQRWTALARDAEFRRSLAAELKLHPEWGPILSPPHAKPTTPAPHEMKTAP